MSAGDYRTQTGVGVLLARYHLYDDAIPHFQAALRASPDSDDVKFDLADAYFRKGLYDQALEAAQQVSRARPTGCRVSGVARRHPRPSRRTLPRRTRFSAMPSAGIPTTTSITFR